VVLHALPSPPALDGSTPGAVYLNAVAQHIQPRWAQFLEDCRVRLAASHALNDMALVATAELAIDRDGRLDVVRIETSGSADFDFAVRDVLADAPLVEAPPVELLSDDDRVHLRWSFARDRRQAGAATASLVRVERPLAAVIAKLLAAGELARAARRVAAAPPDDPARRPAIERVMLAALHEALGGSGTDARRFAVEAIGHVRATSLAAHVRPLASATLDREVRKAAIATLAALDDTSSVEDLAAALPGELRADPEVALAQVRALVALGRADRARAIVRRALDGGVLVGALQAHAHAPDPAVTRRLAGWLARGTAAVREAVCAAIPADGPATLVLRGLRDRDASVRAACADTAARRGRAGATPAVTRRLHELAADRDQRVRARAVAALAVIDPDAVVAAISDPAAEVRVAAVPAAREPDLRQLAADDDADVRAAALARLGDRADALRVAAVDDDAPQVRRVAARTIADPALLSRLAADHAPEVASDALARLVALRGRAAMTTSLLAELAAAPVGSVERVRIALAWLSAPR